MQFLHAINVDSDQIKRVRRLICVIVWRTYQKVRQKVLFSHFAAIMDMLYLSR